MVDIDYSGFLKLPELGNITEIPPEPYKMPTAGNLHIDKFKLVMDYLLYDKISKEELFKDQILASHYVMSTFIEKPDHLLADFCRHVIAINESTAFVWGIADELLRKFDKKFVPSWREPNFTKFNNAFTELSSTFTSFYMNETNRETYRMLQDQAINQGYIDDISFIQFDNTSDLRKIGNMLNLYGLICDTNVLEKIQIDPDRIFRLRRALKALIHNEKEQAQYTFFMRFIIDLQLIVYTEDLDESEMVMFFDDLDRMYHDAKKLDEQDFYAAKVLIGATYGEMANNLMRTDMEFVTKRRLLIQLINQFINPAEYQFERGIELIIEKNNCIELLYFVLQGYHQFAKTIDVLIKELPETGTRDELSNDVSKINNTVRSTIFKFMKEVIGVDPLDNLTSKAFEAAMKEKCTFKRDAYLVKIMISDILGYQLLREENELPDSLFDLVLSIMRQFRGDARVELYELDYQLRKNLFPYGSIIAKIKEDLKEDNILFQSENFEDHIIQKASNLISFLTNNPYLSDHDQIEYNETLVMFIGEFLQRINKDDFYSEALMIITPIVSIAYVQIAKSYYKINKTNSSFLSFLNMHWFMELFVDEISRSDVWRSRKTMHRLDATEIMDKFNSIVKDLEFLDQISGKVIKKTIVNIELTFITDSKTSTQYMVADDIIMSFMDMSSKFNEFFSTNISPEDDKPLREIIKESGIYLEPENNPLSKLDGIGSHTMENDPPEIPFPMIRRISTYSAALKMFPISMPLTEIVGSLRNFSQFIEFYEKSTG